MVHQFGIWFLLRQVTHTFTVLHLSRALVHSPWAALHLPHTPMQSPRPAERSLREPESLPYSTIDYCAYWSPLSRLPSCPSPPPPHLTTTPLPTPPSLFVDRITRYVGSAFHPTLTLSLCFFPSPSVWLDFLPLGSLTPFPISLSNLSNSSPLALFT